MNCGKCGKILTDDIVKNVMNGGPCFCPDCFDKVLPPVGVLSKYLTNNKTTNTSKQED